MKVYLVKTVVKGTWRTMCAFDSFSEAYSWALGYFGPLEESDETVIIDCKEI